MNPHGRMWGYILIAILVVLILVYFVPTSLYRKIFPKSWFANTVQESSIVGPLPLSTSPTVGQTNDSQVILSTGNTGSFQAFVYPMPFQRTGQTTVCADTNPGPGQADCSTGRFGLCACEGNDCSKCHHSGYVNILNISNIIRLELLAAPDASRQGSASVQLVARCLRRKDVVGSTESLEETLVLPSLPFQKWTMITVAREGRRFDIYYNDRLVLSKRVQYVIASQSATSPIIAGDPLLNGNIAHVLISSSKFTARDVANTYINKADTNGEPFLSTDSNLINTITRMSPFCKDASCINGPVIKPASPLMDWQTNYA